jgi:hypothetical protein
VTIRTRRIVAAAILIVVAGTAWFLARPQVPDGQPALVTLDGASMERLREAFNRDADHVRIIILQSPT